MIKIILLVGLLSIFGMAPSAEAIKCYQGSGKDAKLAACPNPTDVCKISGTKFDEVKKDWVFVQEQFCVPPKDCVIKPGRKITFHESTDDVPYHCCCNTDGCTNYKTTKFIELCRANFGFTDCPDEVSETAETAAEPAAPSEPAKAKKKGKGRSFSGAGARQLAAPPGPPQPEGGASPSKPADSNSKPKPPPPSAGSAMYRSLRAAAMNSTGNGVVSIRQFGSSFPLPTLVLVVAASFAFFN